MPFRRLRRALLPRRIRSAAKDLARADGGGSAVEFALAGSLLATLLGGILDFGIILFVNSALEGGLRDASRFALTGFTPATETREQKIIDIINDRLMGLYLVTPNDVSTRVYSSFSNVGQPEPYTDTNHNGQYDVGEPFTDINGNGRWDADMAASGAGGAGQVVVYEVTVNWHVLTPILLPFVSADGTIRLTAGTAVRNEPFN
ncbi:MAG: TadE/TadG family type IV pilus assembly protein [Gemmatimonas sp.]